jgi:hypothetical protein
MKDGDSEMQAAIMMSLVQPSQYCKFPGCKSTTTHYHNCSTCADNNSNHSSSNCPYGE